MDSTPNCTDQNVPTQGSNSSPDKPGCSNDESSPSRLVTYPGPSMAPDNGTKRRSPCNEQEDEEQSSSRKKSKTDDALKKWKFKFKHDLALWKKVWLKKTAKPRISSYEMDTSGSEGGWENECNSDTSLLIKEQMELETQTDSTLSSTEELHKKHMWAEMSQIRSALSCSNDVSISKPGLSGVLPCIGPSTSPNNGTKRRPPCDEQEDEEQSRSRKNSKADDVPKKRKFKLKCDLALWKKVLRSKSAKPRISSYKMDKSGFEGRWENECNSDTNLLINEQMELETQIDFSLSSTEELIKKHMWAEMLQIRSALSCSNDVSISKPGLSGVLSCIGPSTSPNNGTKRRPPCDEQEDEEQSRSRKTSKADDAPKKQKFKFKCDLDLWKKVSRSKSEQMEQETQADSTMSPAERLCKEYKWNRMLAAGGCGFVFAGVRIEDNLPVALKFIRKHIVAYIDVEMDGSSVRLPKEVYVLIRAGASPTSSDSRVTPQLLDWYELDQEIVLVLERPVPCKDLWNWTQRRHISLDLAKIIFRQLVDEAIELESKGIFHRDIKPENVLLETGSDVPRARFIDFGHATFFTPGQKFTNPQGTPMYSSPEWFRENNYTAGPTTAWQMGLVLYVMLFRRRPLIKEVSITSLRSVPISTCLPPDCRDLLKGCLEKDPRKRLSLQSIRDHPWLNL